jgi:1-acyl-sn-glycerol-3-phosphate acyltransferase
MDADNLRRLPFFGWIGAVSLDRGNSRNAYRDLKRSLQLLNRPGRVMWVFAQGRQRPPHLRPLDLQRGVAFLTQQSGAPVVPLSISYLYGDAPRPRLYLHFGEAMAESDGRRSWMKELEARLIGGLEENDRCFLGEGTGYRMLLEPTTDSGDTPPAARLLATLTGAGSGRKGRDHGV